MLGLVDALDVRPCWDKSPQIDHRCSLQSYFHLYAWIPKHVLPIVPVFEYLEFSQILQFLFVPTESHCVIQVQWTFMIPKCGHQQHRKLMEKCAKYGLTEFNISLTVQTNWISCSVLHREVRYGVCPEFHIKIYTLSHCSQTIGDTIGMPRSASKAWPKGALAMLNFVLRVGRNPE